MFDRVILYYIENVFRLKISVSTFEQNTDILFVPPKSSGTKCHKILLFNKLNLFKGFCLTLLEF